MGSWFVVWVPDPERWGVLPAEGVLGVRDLPQAVARIGLRPGDPVFVRPDGAVDTDLLDVVRSKDFRGLEREKKRNYATVNRLARECLYARRESWRDESTPDLPVVRVRCY